jgi:hypothetical protein
MYSSIQNDVDKDEVTTPSKRRHSKRSIVPYDSDEDLPDPSPIIDSGGRTRKSATRPEYMPPAHLDADDEDIPEAPLSPQANIKTLPSSARKQRFFARKGPRVAPFDEPQPVLIKSVEPIVRRASESVWIPGIERTSEPNIVTTEPTPTASNSPDDIMTPMITKLETLNKEIDPLESSLLVTKMEIKEIDMKIQKLEQLRKAKETKRIEVVTQLKDKKRKKESLEGVLEAFKT